METPWERSRKIRLSKRQEESFSRKVGAKKQINSGRLWHSKRDNTIFDFLVENRTTEKAETKSYSIKVEELKKLTDDAIFHNRLPAMNIEFPFYFQNWMLVRTADFEAFIDRVTQLEAQVEALSKESKKDG